LKKLEKNKTKMQAIAWVFIVGLLVFGTTTALTAKIQYQTCVPGNGGNKVFNRPWLESMFMFMAMSFSLVGYWILQCCKSEPNTEGGDAPLLVNEVYSKTGSSREPETKKLSNMYVWIMVPSLLDLVATSLSGIGLLWVDASVYQMLRGSLMIFSALLSVFCLGKRLKPYHWWGIGFCVTAVAMVGWASVEEASTAKGENVTLEVFGIALIVLGQFVQACQIVSEEKLLKDFKANPLVIVGMEGVWGVLWMAVVLGILQVTPSLTNTCQTEAICQCDWDQDTCSRWADSKDDFTVTTDCQSAALYHEDTAESWKMLKGSRELVAIVMIYLLAILFYNISGMNVTKHMSAIHRSILEALRTLCIWIADLVIFYGIKWEGHGEQWTKWSPLQAVGFVILITGNLVYNKILKLPWLDYTRAPYKSRAKFGGEQLPHVANYSPGRVQALPSMTPINGVSGGGWASGSSFDGGSIDGGSIGPGSAHGGKNAQTWA